MRILFTAVPLNSQNSLLIIVKVVWLWWVCSSSACRLQHLSNHVHHVQLMLSLFPPSPLLIFHLLPPFFFLLLKPFLCFLQVLNERMQCLFHCSFCSISHKNIIIVSTISYLLHHWVLHPQVLCAHGHPLQTQAQSPEVSEPAPGIHLPEEKSSKGVLHFDLFTYHLVIPHCPGKVVRSRLCPVSKKALWLACAPECCPANYKICMFFASFLPRCCLLHLLFKFLILSRHCFYSRSMPCFLSSLEMRSYTTLFLVALSNCS